MVAVPASGQNTHMILIGGLGGDPEYTESFHTWVSRFADAAMEDYGVPADRITYLAERTDLDPTRVSHRSTLENIRDAFANVGSSMAPNDHLVVFLAGHGTFRDNTSRFNIPGPDLTPTDLAGLVAPLGTRQVTVINVATASGPFVEALSGPNRTIITATRSGRELNQTRFGLHFVDAFAGDGADLDKDGRVSMYEAYVYAQTEVGREYENDQQILTEHSLLDDNGDGEGSFEVAVSPGAEGDGTKAAQQFLTSDSQALGVQAATPELRQLLSEKAELDVQIAQLRSVKAQLDPTDYENQLEDRLVSLALKTREIRAAGGGS